MNWKICFIAIFNIVLVVFPYNIIGCLEPPDPYDEYTSFFRNDLSPAKLLQPFYYVNESQLYSFVDADSTTDEACAEWSRYCRQGVTVNQAHRFICRTAERDLQTLETQLKKHSKPALPADLPDNRMTRYFIHSRDTTALAYIRFARTSEPFRIAGGQTWNTNEGWRLTMTDSLSINSLIAQAIAGYNATSNDFIRARYGFQAVSLTFYNHRNQDCIRLFGTLLQNKKAAGSLYAQALAFKAGALLRLDQKILAAYDYSRAFSISGTKVSNYLSFSWCISRKNTTDLNKCLSLCRNARERADMTGLFSLGRNTPEEASLKSIYQLDPSSPVLEVLALREVNKIEDNYFTPRLSRQPGGKVLYIQEWAADQERPGLERWRQEALSLAGWYDALSWDPAIPHQGLYVTAAAHLCYILRQYPRSIRLLERAAHLPGDEKLRSQQALTRLLVTINQYPVIDSIAEEQLLPSLQWLEKKAIGEGKGMYHANYYRYSNGRWQQFYRNLLAEILAKRYHEQGEIAKEMLCIGAGEKMINIKRDEYFYPTDLTKTYVQENLSTKELQSLWTKLYGPTAPAWGQYLAQRFPMTRQELVLCMATSLTRDHRWRDALGWLAHINNKALLKLDRNPFGVLLSDRQDSTLPADKGRFDRIGFITRMALLSEKAQTQKASAQELYQLAVGYYNMTYYGRVWEAVKFDRTGALWAELPVGNTVFEKDFYGCYTAENYFRRAMDASHDANFKAGCLFMMAKAAQKRFRIAVPPAATATAWNKTYDAYVNHLIDNKYFPALRKDYGNTPFYREAFNTCSFLRDFVRRSK